MMHHIDTMGLSEGFSNTLKGLESKLLQIILQRTGIVVPSTLLKTLYAFIQQDCQRLSLELDAYLARLANTPVNSSLFERIISQIVIGESYFFRDQQQMKLLQETLLPQIIKRKQQQDNLNLRIWSAGTAGGEEIYTLALIIYEMLPSLADWKLHLLGTDIDTQALKKASVGFYRPWSMRTIPKYFLEKYFIKEKDGYQLCSEILRLVTLRYLNLVEPHYPELLNGTSSLDLILCRNVLIYFDTKHIDFVVKRLAGCLDDDGILMFGASDPINYASTCLISHFDKSAYFTRKACLGEEYGHDSI
ncbi:CheR family methyltransferase [Legionella septentrionalis]|uniref:CheR family methyltransferase n=1 Tax=Legionella septentrionalis TaxID=2498109 RepID=UPI000F8DA50D|nr:protein-glutamate O-methyltransferase CheR [Legionella septentrionalis]RUR11700.1 protein-glutamate O-methyltransferase CheR [Legionella septentrionalis]